MDNIEAKSKLSAILMQPSALAYKVASLYIVYKTIEANDNITLNKLKRLLNSDLLIKPEVIDGAVASLSSASIFNVVSKWIRPYEKNQSEVIHLRLTKEPAPEFVTWVGLALKEFPELSAFIPPTLP